MTYAQDERAALAALLDETGPDGPTLCEGWQTRDLVAHLVLRERRPDAAAGVMGGPLAGYTARVQRQYLDRYSYPELVALFRSGPPRLSPFAIPGADEAANTVEYFVHHEDVRRAAPGWTERALDAGPGGRAVEAAEGRAAVPALARRPGSCSARENGGKLDLIVAKTAAPWVTVTGTPAELTMWSMGRASAAHVADAWTGAELARWRGSASLAQLTSRRQAVPRSASATWCAREESRAPGVASVPAAARISRRRLPPTSL